MAKAAWLTVAPMSGVGNATITNTGTVHTGREQRTTTVTGTATGVSPNKTYTVVQKAKPEFVSFDNGAEITVPKTGGTLTITGKSNSSKLTFALLELTDDGDTANVVEGGLKLTLPAKYNAGGAQTSMIQQFLVTPELRLNLHSVLSLQVLQPIQLSMS